MFIKSNIIDALGGNRVFSSLTAALTYVESILRQQQQQQNDKLTV